MITSTKLYVPVVTVSINDNIKLLENLKQGFSKYRFEITTQAENNNLDYLIDPTFRNINRLLVLSFKNGNGVPTRDSFDEYHMPLLEFKDFNALIDSKPFFDQPIKKQEVYEKHIKMSRNNGRKFIRLFVSSKILLTHWCRFIIANKYEYSSTN